MARGCYNAPLWPGTRAWLCAEEDADSGHDPALKEELACAECLSWPSQPIWPWLRKPVAQSKALQRCQAKGSDCSLLRTGLHGNGAWIALATDPTVPAPHCLPVGQYYSASKETAERMAVAACQKNGGRNCQISFIRQNKGQTTYPIVPGTGGATSPPTFSNH